MQNLVLIFCILVFTGNTAFSSVLPESMKSTMVHDYGMPSMFNLVFSMFFVIALIYLTGWVYQKLNLLNKKQVSKLSSDTKNVRFNVLQSMSLGQQRQIYTIEMNGKILLVGSTPSQINLIKEFDCINDVNTAISGDNSNSASEIIKQEEKSVDIDELFKKYKN